MRSPVIRRTWLCVRPCATGFRPIADHIIQAATSGTMQMDFAVIPYSRRDTNYFPRVDDPLMV
jgi:microcystin degradation protein MlrC